MIDITKEEFWDNKYEETSKEKTKTNKVKEFIINHKIVTVLLTSLGILMVVNTIMVMNFFNMLTEM